jgi:hypothetical protein
MTMKAHRLLIAVTFINLATLAVNLTMLRASAAPDVAPVLRGRSLEIVDANGRARATLGVLSAGVSAAGDRSDETVLLRLITERGRPSVKIGASEQSAGLSFAGPSDTRDTYAILESKGKESWLKLRNENGREQIIKP